MIKTGRYIEDDIFQMVRESPLSSFVDGGVYKQGLRPFGSESEDIIVSFSAGSDGQTQAGMVAVNIYVKDINVGSQDGALLPDTSRLRAVEEKLAETIISIDEQSYEYDITTESTVQSFEVPDLGQHVVTALLRYRRITI